MTYNIGDLVRKLKDTNKKDGGKPRVLVISGVDSASWDYIDDGMYFAYKYRVADANTGCDVGIFHDEELALIDRTQLISGK